MGFCNSISSVAPDPNDEHTVCPKPKKRGWGLKKKESGRLESAPSDDKAPSRDGLHSAPSGDAAAKQEKLTSPSKVMDRGGLHSAPPDRKSVTQSAALSEFLVEGVNGVSAADADTYCADILGAPLCCLGCCLGCLRALPPQPTRPTQGPRWSRSFALPSGPRACTGWRRCRR